MRFTQLTLMTWFAVAITTCGCEQNKPTPQAGTAKSGSHSHDDGTSHEHSRGDGDDHSDAEPHDHGNGPHGGAVADWSGGKLHVEFTVNHDQKEARVYILGPDAKTAHAIDAAEIMLVIKDPKMQVNLQASPQADDPSGKASCFVGNHDGLATVQEYEGTISGTDGDTPYSGSFKEVAPAGQSEK